MTSTAAARSALPPMTWARQLAAFTGNDAAESKMRKDAAVAEERRLFERLLRGDAPGGSSDPTSQQQPPQIPRFYFGRRARPFAAAATAAIGASQDLSLPAADVRGDKDM